MKKIFFLCDAHLGSWAMQHRRTQERRLVRFLDSIKDRTYRRISGSTATKGTITLRDNLKNLIGYLGLTLVIEILNLMDTTAIGSPRTDVETRILPLLCKDDKRLTDNLKQLSIH